MTYNGHNLGEGSWVKLGGIGSYTFVVGNLQGQKCGLLCAFVIFKYFLQEINGDFSENQTRAIRLDGKGDNH